MTKNISEHWKLQGRGKKGDSDAGKWQALLRGEIIVNDSNSAALHKAFADLSEREKAAMQATAQVPARVVRSSTTPYKTKGLDKWWEEHYELGGTQNGLTFDDAESMTPGNGISGGRRRSRRLYTSPHGVVRMPNITSIRRIAKENGGKRFTEPIEYQLNGRVAKKAYLEIIPRADGGYATRIITGDGREVSEAGAMFDHSKVAEIIHCGLNAKRGNMLSSIATMPSPAKYRKERHRAREKMWGVAAQVNPSWDSNKRVAVGGSTVDKTAFIELGAHAYEYCRDPKVIQEILDTDNPHAVYEDVLRGKKGDPNRPLARRAQRCKECGRFSSLDVQHMCPPPVPAPNTHATPQDIMISARNTPEFQAVRNARRAYLESVRYKPIAKRRADTQEVATERDAELARQAQVAAEARRIKNQKARERRLALKEAKAAELAAAEAAEKEQREAAERAEQEKAAAEAEARRVKEEKAKAAAAEREKFAREAAEKARAAQQAAKEKADAAREAAEKAKADLAAADKNSSRTATRDNVFTQDPSSVFRTALLDPLKNPVEGAPGGREFNQAPRGFTYDALKAVSAYTSSLHVPEDYDSEGQSHSAVSGCISYRGLTGHDAQVLRDSIPATNLSVDDYLSPPPIELLSAAIENPGKVYVAGGIIGPSRGDEQVLVNELLVTQASIGETDDVLTSVVTKFSLEVGNYDRPLIKEARVPDTDELAWSLSWDFDGDSDENQ